MRAIQKAQARVRESRQLTLVPRIMNMSPGGTTYFGQAYKWEQVVHLKGWFGVGIRCWQREVAGGEAPKLGTLSPKETAEKSLIQKCKSLGYGARDIRMELFNAALRQKEIRRRSYNPLNKALGGPKEHEEFTAWESDHGIVKLFQVPNNLDCSADLWNYSVMFWLLTGELYWWVIRNEWGVPVEVWVIPSHWITRKATDFHGNPTAYIVTNPWGQTQQIPYDDVLYFFDHSPLDRHSGYGISLMISEWIDAYETMLRSRLAQNINGGIPAFHVALSDEYVDPDEAMLNRYYSKWFARFQGPDNAGKPLITGPGVEVNALGISPVDMDYVNTENQFRDMILAALGVPKGVVGLEPSSDVSAYAPQRQFLRFSVNPFLGMLGQRITHGLIRRTPHCEDGVCFWDDRVIDDPEQQRNEETHLWEKGAISPDEIRNRHGMEPWPFGGDDPFVNGEQLSWATGQQSPQDAELGEAVGRAEAGDIAMRPVESALDDEPLIIDKVEEEPVPKAEPKLRWFRTRDGNLEARGQSGKWYVERKRRKDGKIGYILHKNGEEFDASLAIGLLKMLAEDEEEKALGGTTGTGGGYAVPVEQISVEQSIVEQAKRLTYHDDGSSEAARRAAVARALRERGLVAKQAQSPINRMAKGLSESERIEHNAMVTDLLRRSGILNGKTMVIGNGKH